MLRPKARIIDPRDIPEKPPSPPCYKCKGAGIVYKRWGKMICPYCHDWHGNKLKFPFRNAKIFKKREG